MLEDAKLLDDDYDDGRRTWGTSIELDGVTYATSLFWQPLQNKDDPFTEVGEASEGVMEGADLFCIKQGKAPQFGICASKEGYKSGENVAAVTLATAMADKSSFIAVFKVDNGWWYTCVRNDIILSDGDMLFLNEQDAKNQFLSMLAVPDWGRKIAPPEWNLEETEYLDLNKLMSQGMRAKLQKIKALRGTKLMVVIAISAIIGLWLLSSIINGIFLAPPKRPIIAPVAPKVVKPVEKIPEIKPWEKISDPEQVMLNCYKAVQDVVTIMPPGWVIGNISCSTGGLTTSWTREVGKISWIEQALDMSGITFSGRSISDNGNSLIASVPLPKIKQISSPPLKNDIDLKNTLNNLFQSIGQSVNLSSFAYTSPEQNVYRSVQFKFSSIHNPSVWSDLLTKFSGLDITMIRYNTRDKTWEYEGAIYVL